MKKILVANQKTYLNKEEAEAFLNEFKEEGVIFCPSFPFLSMFNNHIIGAQDISKEESSSLTGEITASQLKSLGCQFAIVGHSERRQNEKEDNTTVNKKLLNAEASSLIPILCVGESKEDYDLAKTKEVVETQLRECLKDSTGELIIAYEPIWAIGTGVVPNNQEIKEVITYIKSLYPKYKVLYGGSVKASNIKELNQVEGVDGYLIGGASSIAKELSEIVKSCQ